MLRNMKKKLHRTVAAALSVFLVAGVMVPVEAGARSIPTDAESYAYGNQLHLGLLADAGLLTDAAGTLLDLETLELMEAEQAWMTATDSDQTANPQDIDLSVLNLIHIKLGTLPPIPLIGSNGLIHGDLGALREYAHSPYATETTGSAGLINNDGSLNLSSPGNAGNINLELTTLLGLQDLLANNLLDQAGLELGAVSAFAQKPDSFLNEGNLCDVPGTSLVEYDNLDNSGIGTSAGGTYGILPSPMFTEDDGKFCSDYQIADAILIVDSPLVDNLTTGIGDLISGLDSSVNALIGSTGLVNGLLGVVNNLNFDILGFGLVSLRNSAEVSVDLKLSKIVDQLTADDKPLSDSTGLIYVNLGTGEISIDLDKLHEGGLNSLDPNTPLVSAAQLTQITTVLNNLLLADSAVEPNGLNARLEGLLYGDKNPDGTYAQTGGLYATEVNIHLDLELRVLVPVAEAELDFVTTLGGLLNPDAETTDSRSVYDADPYGKIYQTSSGVGKLIALILDSIGGITGFVGGALVDILFGGNGQPGTVPGLLQGVIPLVNTLLNAIDPVLKGVIQPLANVIVNRQKVEEKTQGNLFTVSALEVNVLQGGTLATLPLATASVLAQSFEPTSLELGKFVQNEEGVTVPDDYTLNYVCTYEEFEEAYERRNTGSIPPVSVLDRLSGNVVLQHNTTETVEGLPAGASCVITETAPDTDPTSKWTGEWTTDRDWEAGDLTDESPDPVILVAEETMFIAAVNSYETAFIDLGINVAKLGTGRNLHSGGYQYNVVCTVDGDPVEGNGGSITYPDAAVGEYFTFDNGEFFLREATDPAPDPIPVLPGSECTITTSAGISADPALRPTGDNTDKNREPYTYFLYTDENEANVADALNENTVSVDATDQKVSVAAEKVGGGWKTHAYTFTVPEDADSHSVNIVHAYDIDERDVVVTKKVLGEDHEDEVFDFRHLTDGADWTEVKNVADEGQFTIRVPVLDENLDSYELTVQEILEPTSVTPVSGPVVSWELDRTPHDHEYRDVEDNWYSETIVGITPVTDAAVLETPPLALDVTNSYAEIEVDKHIEGLLDGVGKTTLHPFGEDKMTISYTVENIGAVDLDTIRIYDPSLVNSLFDLPEHIRVDSSTGEVNGCVLAFNDDGVASCSFEVSFADPDVPFHYEADTAEVTAEATTVIEGREIKATATDKHGAMRLSDLVGMLPATGVTTLVWVMALGLIAALTALALYVRSRRK